MRYVFALFILTSVGVHAAEPLESCIETAKNASELSVCYGQESERQDTQLNVAIDEEVRKWTYGHEFEKNGWSKEQLAELRRNLRQSQVEWTKYRSAWCHYISNTMNGSGGALVFSKCMVEMTKERLTALASW